MTYKLQDQKDKKKQANLLKTIIIILEHMVKKV